MTDLTIALLLCLPVLLPLVALELRDIRGCAKNCNQGRRCNCKEKTK